MNTNTYQPSGKYAATLFPLVIAFYLLGIPFLSVVYSLLIWYIPFIYLNFFLTIGLVVAMSWCLNQLSKWGKLRNIKMANYIAFFAGILAIYLVWASYVTLLVNAGDTVGTGSSYRDVTITKTFFNITHFIGIISSPASIVDAMAYLYDNGSWSIKSITVSGFFLAVIWFIEAVIIVVGTWLAGTDQADEPFSEVSNSWFDKKELPYYIQMPEALNEFLDKLNNGQSSILKTLEYDSQSSLDYAQITTFSHESEQVAYINFSHTKVTFDDKGKESKSTDILAKNILVSMVDLNEMETKFGH